MEINEEQSKHLQEIESLRLHHRYLLDTLKVGIVVLDAADVVSSCNDMTLSLWGLGNVRVLGERLQATELAHRCPELRARVQNSKIASSQQVSFECRIPADGTERVLSVLIRPVIAEQTGERAGTIIYTEDITAKEKLKETAELLEAVREELRLANEELETTNEELQSTNEELQSTNEGLEITNKELQSLNEELKNLSEQLEARTRELNRLTDQYAETLKRLPLPIMLVDGEEKIQLWNAAAQRLFGVGISSVIGVEMNRLPMESELRDLLQRRCRAVIARGKPVTVHGMRLGSTSFDVQFTPISRDESGGERVMVMFGPSHPEKGNGSVRGTKDNKITTAKDNKKATSRKAAKPRAVKAKSRTRK